jgi:hypothetical protein
VTLEQGLRRLRLPLGFALGGAYLALARPDPRALLLGGAVALVGLLVRAWAAGHIVKDSQLTTTGPYAHTRNPLYFGSFLLAAGFAIAAHWALLIVVIALFVIIYAPTIAHERTKIRGRYPEAYAAWERNVPAFVPRLTPWTGASGGPGGSFSLALYMRHGEWKAGLVYVLAIAWLAVRSRTGG